MLFRSYGLKLYMFIHMSLLLILHIVGMILGSNKGNGAKDGSMERYNLLHIAWDGEIFYDKELSTLGKNHFISCISCIYEFLGHHMVATWRFIDEEG